MSAQILVMFGFRCRLQVSGSLGNAPVQSQILHELIQVGENAVEPPMLGSQRRGWVVYEPETQATEEHVDVVDVLPLPGLESGEHTEAFALVRARVVDEREVLEGPVGRVIVTLCGSPGVAEDLAAVQGSYECAAVPRMRGAKSLVCPRHRRG